MKSTLILLTWACFITNSFTQYLTIADSNAVWSIINEKDFSVGDTIIGANTYIKIKTHYQNSYTPPVHSYCSFLIRSESNGKSYYRSGGNDYLLYDFSVNQGDTGTVYSTQTTDPAYFTVDSTNIINFMGVPRKVVYVHDTMGSGPDEWIEGIGSIYGFQYGNINLTGLLLDLFCGPWNIGIPLVQCYHENGINLFQGGFTTWGMVVVDSCYAVCTFGINPSLDLQFSLFPNPSTEFINISGIEYDNYSCSIINNFGQIFQSQQLTVTNSQVDISSLPSGIYFLAITNQQTNKKTVLKFSKVE